MGLVDLKLKAEVADESRLRALRTRESPARHKKQKNVAMELEPSAEIKSVIAGIRAHADEVVNLGQQFQSLRGLMSGSKTQDATIRQMIGEPISSFPIQLKGADSLGHFDR